MKHLTHATVPVNCRLMARAFAALAIAAAVVLASAAPAAAQTEDDIALILKLGREDAPDDAPPQLFTDPSTDESAPATGATSRPMVREAAPALDVEKLSVQFRQAKQPAGTRIGIASRLMQDGERGTRVLTGLVLRTFHDDHRAYLERYEKAAWALARSRLRGDAGKQIDALREAVLALGKDPNLSKQQIAEVGDPAMAKLAELLIVDRSAVFGSDAELRSSRADLMELAVIWHRAASSYPALTAEAEHAPPHPSKLEQELGWIEQWVGHIAAPMDATSRQATVANFRIAAHLDDEDARGILKLNMMRVQLGLSVLAIDVKLGDAARGHSKDMRAHDFFSHVSPVKGKESFVDRARLAGTDASGENIFFGSSSGDAAIQAWWYSPGHHRNMLNEGYRRIGLGREGNHFTQMFGR